MENINSGKGKYTLETSIPIIVQAERLNQALAAGIFNSGFDKYILYT